MRAKLVEAISAVMSAWTKRMAGGFTARRGRKSSSDKDEAITPRRSTERVTAAMARYAGPMQIGRAVELTEVVDVQLTMSVPGAIMPSEGVPLCDVLVVGSGAANGKESAKKPLANL